MQERITDRKDLLYIKDLRVVFSSEDEDHIALNDISAIIKEGEIIAIVGESGAGKSLLCRSIMRLLPQNAKVSNGKIFYKEKWDIFNCPENDIYELRSKEIAMIFQDPLSYANPVLTCGDQIAESVVLNGITTQVEIKNKVLELLKIVGFEDPERIFTSFPHQLSGGQLQRVLIAMALAINPSILLADEPTTALDVVQQEHILSLFKEINTRFNTTIVLVTHDLSLARRIADRVLVMHKGRIVERGDVVEVFQRPEHIYTKALMMCKPPVREKFRLLPTIPAILENQQDLTVFSKDAMRVTESEREKRKEYLNDQPEILKVNNLSYEYRSFLAGKKFNAIDQISFSIKKGECLGIVGESGSGKTTLAQCISGLIEVHNKSDIQFFEKENQRLLFFDRKQRSRFIQYIFQNTFDTLDPRQPVLEGVAEIIRFHRIRSDYKKSEEYALELLKAMGFRGENLHKLPHEFSSGQRQRIVLARSLSLNPKLLVCDEPVSSLDVSVQAEVLNIFKKRVVDTELSCIFISHDISTVRYLADRILVLKGGHMVELGETEEIITNPGNEYTRKLIDAAFNMD